MRRTYHQFPQKPELERKYNFREGLPYIIKIISGMDGQFGTFITDAPDLKARPIRAKRSISVEIADRSTNFYPLNKNTLEHVLQDMDIEGTIDFRVNLKYSFLDKRYDRVPFMGDSYIVRAQLENGILTMKIHHMEGMGRTECGRVVDTIVDEIIRNAPNV